MSAADAYLGLRAFVDELVRCGVRHACTSPGSRSTPLVLSLVWEERLETSSHLDERCGAFFALGVAKASGVPAVLACTSGTAAANYLPAVVEAHEARVPLIVLTADRPPELRDVGAGQTIDQVKLYGTAVKTYVEVDDHPATEGRVRWLRQLACRMVWTATAGRPGPVHVNFALREPLVLDAPLPPEPAPLAGREGGRPWVTRPAPPAPVPPALLDGLAAELAARPRAVIVAGRAERDPGLGPALAALAERARIPLLADPLSGARRGPAAVAHYDALLRDPGWAGRNAPQLVLRFGDLPTSKPLRQWLAGLGGALQVAVDDENAWQDPAAAVATIAAADPRSLAEGLAERVAAPAEAAWLDGWRRADRAAAGAIAATLGPAGLSEPRVAAELGVRLPAAATLVVASSMPVRDAESFFPVRDDPPRTLSNRGANGIDGTVSTAFGVAAAGGGPGGAADRRRGARPRPRRAARRAPARARADDRAGRQRRRRHLPLPARGRRRRGVRDPRRHAARAGLRPRGGALRLRLRGPRLARGLPGRARRRAGLERHHDPARADRAREPNRALHAAVSAAVTAAIA